MGSKLSNKSTDSEVGVLQILIVGLFYVSLACLVVSSFFHCFLGSWKSGFFFLIYFGLTLYSTIEN